jgi:SAM-dependent methyltransferase
MDYIPDKFELYEYVAEHDRSHLRSVRHFIGEMERFQSYEAWADLLTTAFKGVEGGRRFYDVLIHDREGLRVLSKRYLLVKMLVDNGLIDQGNLEGNVVDVGCYKGASTDALSLFGGQVYGVDSDPVVSHTLSGKLIVEYGGRDFIKFFNRWWPENGPINLVTCFHADSIDRDLGFPQRLCETALEQLTEGGQVLMTFDHKARIEKLRCYRGEQINLLSRIASNMPRLYGSSDKFIYLVKKPSEDDSTDSIDPVELAKIVANGTNKRR